MDDFLNLFGTPNSSNQEIPKEIINQYPYGEFPLRYTKSGQEIIRKQSESRFKYDHEISPKDQPKNDINLNTLLPIIQMLSGGKKNPKDMMQLFGKLLFKNNPDMQKLFSLLPNIKGQNIIPETKFPDTNKIQISSLKKID